MEVSEEQSNVMSNKTVSVDEPGEEGEKKSSEVWSQDMERNRRSRILMMMRQSPLKQFCWTEKRREGSHSILR